jgi:asparagine synthase (glutamine-hydrolysing)
MYGIACIRRIRSDPAELRERALAMARLLRHRGPGWSGVYGDGDALLGVHRNGRGGA